ncbi:MAG: PAS domain S-box protein [Chloroflexi bacterium]|nr:PAS domain S-box protein [Chloroflexota bacterium]
MDDESLRQSLHELYEQAPCGYLFTLPDGTITRVNQTFLSLTGYDRVDFARPRRFQDLLTVAGRLFYENQYAPLLLLQGRVSEVTFDLVRKEGDRVPILLNSVLRVNSQGQAIEVATTIFEASDRRRYEQELLVARRKADQLAAVVTESDDAILTVSPGAQVETWNPGAERLFGYDAQAMRGQNLGLVLPAIGEIAAWQPLHNELGAGRSVHLESFGLRVDASRVDVSVGLAPHLGPLGELSAVSLIVRDITARRDLERLQQEFLAMANHELRTPVAIIKLRAQVMKRGASYNEQAVDAIVQQADQLGRLIDDMLTASQIEADRLDLRLAEMDLGAEAQAAAGHLEASGRRIRVDVPSTPVVVRADRQRLAQIFANLLTNAAKYSPEQSEISLRVFCRQHDVLISVADQGDGIPAGALPHLFERFYRVAGTAEHVRGVGLGLYICRRIVEAHGGTISVESEPGQGSTFTVVLPRGYESAIGLPLAAE